MIDSKWYMRAKGWAEGSVCAEISLNGTTGLTTSSPLSLSLFFSVNVLSTQTTDDIVSSAECSSDDEDLEECDSGHTGGMSVSRCACSETWSFSPLSYLSLICYRGASPPSIMPHGSSKCNFQIKKKIVAVRNILLNEEFNMYQEFLFLKNSLELDKSRANTHT